MTAFASAEDGFMNTMEALRLMLGLKPHSIESFLDATQFGFHGYSISVSQLHVEYLNSLNLTITPHLPAFNAGAINRWKLINELLLAGFVTVPPGTTQLSTQFPALAALAAFPTLEEVARQISGRWDEEGLVLREITEADGVFTWKSDGTSEKKVWKTGKLIMGLAHKLQLMDASLDPKLRKTIESLDKVLRKPMIEGMDHQPMSPLYSRLQYFRDHWVHGRRFDGWEALLISLLLALIYFGSQRVSQD
jgi:hypothetical protein